MAKLAPIDLERRTGCWFGIAFVYTAKGVKMLTGDWGRINEYCKKHFGPCHGMLITPHDKRWELLGANREDWWVSLSYVSRKRTLKELGLTRPCFVLQHKSYKYNGPERVIRTWRRLPKKHINFKKIIKDAV